MLQIFVTVVFSSETLCLDFFGNPLDAFISICSLQPLIDNGWPLIWFERNVQISADPAIPKESVGDFRGK